MITVPFNTYMMVLIIALVSIMINCLIVLFLVFKRIAEVHPEWIFDDLGDEDED